MSKAIFDTFYTSLRSVGTACTMASVGIYLHRRKFIIGDGKRTLALISQQVTIPAFLFTKIVYCNQDWSDAPCPNVLDSVNKVWILLIWPIYVVGCGLLVGWVVSVLTNIPRGQRRSILAACAFGNSTGLVITLLAVIHSSFPSTSKLGKVDPTLFLSVYLLLYPVLQWGIGGWLLSENDCEKNGTGELSKFKKSDLNNVLNHKTLKDSYYKNRRGIDETDASLYMSHPELEHLNENERYRGLGDMDASCYVSNKDLNQLDIEHKDISEAPPQNGNEVPLNAEEANINIYNSTMYNTIEVPLAEFSKSLDDEFNKRAGEKDDVIPLKKTLSEVMSRCLQPPVIGAILGLLVASTDLRGMFVDLVNRADKASLEWIFDGLYSVGQAAVPVNMIILGCNLSSSQMNNDSPKLLSTRAMSGIVVGKMIVMPIIGIISGLVLQHYILDIPEDIAPSFYLVIMIVFITPTANNVMVMVELSDSGSKEGIAQVIGLQYLCAPVLLSLSVTAVVGVVALW